MMAAWQQWTDSGQLQHKIYYSFRVSLSFRCVGSWIVPVALPFRMPSWTNSKGRVTNAPWQGPIASAVHHSRRQPASVTSPRTHVQRYQVDGLHRLPQHLSCIICTRSSCRPLSTDMPLSSVTDWSSFWDWLLDIGRLFVAHVLDGNGYTFQDYLSVRMKHDC